MSSCHCVIVSSCWQLLASCGNFWQSLINFVNFWQSFVTFGNPLHLLATFGILDLRACWKCIFEKCLLSNVYFSKVYFSKAYYDWVTSADRGACDTFVCTFSPGSISDLKTATARRELKNVEIFLLILGQIALTSWVFCKYLTKVFLLLAPQGALRDNVPLEIIGQSTFWIFTQSMTGPWQFLKLTTTQCNFEQLKTQCM